MQLPPLILLHGYPFDHTMWEKVAQAIRESTKVFIPNLPGFGGTPVPTVEPAIDYIADRIAALCDAEKIKRAVVAGMSMGGYVALAFAERYPARLAGLGLVSTQAIADTDDVRKGRREMMEKVRREGPQAAANAAITKLFAPAHLELESLKQFPINGAQKAGVDGICWALEAMARRPDRTATLKKIKVPTLVLHGTEDKFIPHERARQMAEQIDDAEYMEIKGSGHALPIEAPEAVVQSLRRLLERAAAFSPLPGAVKSHDRPGLIISPTEHGL